MRRLALFLTPLTLLSMAWAADPQTQTTSPSVSPQVQVDPLPITISSAAVHGVLPAPDSLASIYGPNLASFPQAAGNPPWPTMLGDMPGVFIVDSAGKYQTCSLIYVSQTQMNVWIPPGTATGNATLNFPFTGLGIGVGTAALRVTPITILKVSPSLFSMDGTGSGVAAATAVSVFPNNLQFPVPVFQCDNSGKCTPVPINLGLDTPIFLSLYGTGIRGHNALAQVTVIIGGQKIDATYAGPQNQTPGLDQVNVPLPLSLRGAGLVDVAISADGVLSNTVQILIQ